MKATTLYTYAVRNALKSGATWKITDKGILKLYPIRTVEITYNPAGQTRTCFGCGSEVCVSEYSMSDTSLDGLEELCLDCYMKSKDNRLGLKTYSFIPDGKMRIAALFFAGLLVKENRSYRLKGGKVRYYADGTKRCFCCGERKGFDSYAGNTVARDGTVNICRHCKEKEWSDG